MSQSRCIVVIVSCIIFVACAYSEQKLKIDKYFIAVLDSELESQKDPSKHDVLDKLYDLKEKSKNPNPLLVDLLDYYIGEGPSEILTEFITEKGKTMLPLLTAKKAQTPECLPKYKTICIDNIKLRNEDIDWMIDAIQKGIVLRVEDPNAK